MNTEEYDVVILGGGNAAMGVTRPTRAAGLSVAMIESRDLGGTCPNRGCTPKKILVAAAHALDEINRASAHHIKVAPPTLDWSALIAREKNMIGGIPDRLQHLMDERGVKVVHGEARFAGPNIVSVNGRVLKARHIVIATGSTPRALSLPGASLMVTSDDVLSDPTLPREAVFIGGGVIAMEFAHVYARAGVAVTILEVLPRLLNGVDSDAVAELHRETTRIGISVHTGVQLTRIEPGAGRLRVVYEDAGQERMIDTDRVVNCAGRVANVERLDLDTANVKHARQHIEVDAFLRSTSNPTVHVCGDALWSSPQLSPLATYEGSIVGRNIVDGPSHRPDYAAIPSCIYTIPALASVGMTEDQAKARGLAYKAHVNDMSDWLSARTFAEVAAWSKIIVDEATDRIFGAHILGHAGEELINMFALAMRHDLTAANLTEAIYGFPTFSADIRSMM